MPFGMFTRSVGHDSSLALVAIRPTAQACVACLLFLAPEAGISVAGSCMDVYRLAYEQARASLEPSRFQVMLQPCWN